MDDDVDVGKANEAVPGDEGGISRRTMIRRTAIAGGALLWATPVVQSLGNDSAYAWFRGSGEPGGCICSEKIVTIVPVACHAEPGTKHRIKHSGKYVTLQVLTGGSCGTRLGCAPTSETSVWTQVSAVGCSIYSQSGDKCVVHVTSYPASIVLQVTTTLVCTGDRGHSKSCIDTKVRKICFSQVIGSESQRCGRFEPHRNTRHGTERCATQDPGTQGCSPGYWKNHPAAWADTPYSPTDTVGSVFTLPAELSSFSGETLLKALGGAGGTGLNGATTILLRAAVAALLNASDPNVDFGLTPSAVVTQVNQALASKDRDTILALATKLDTANNLGCPLS
jgi:hypothetical protein